MLLGNDTSTLIINLAPTGMVPTRQQTQHVPLSPAEIATDIARCAALGVSVAHVHARGEDGAPSDDPGIFADIIRRVRAETPDLVVTTTTSGRRVQEIERRAATLFLDGDAKPDMASLTLGSMNFATEASIDPPATIIRLASIMRDKGIRPELEVFDLGMVNVAKMLADKGVIEPVLFQHPGGKHRHGTGNPDSPWCADQ